MKPTGHLFIAAWLDFGGGRVICCCLLRSLGGFGCLLFGFLTAPRILRGISPKCTNLGMLVSRNNDKRDAETYMLHGILVCLPGVVREVRLHMLFNKEVVRRGCTLFLLPVG